MVNALRSVQQWWTRNAGPQSKYEGQYLEFKRQTPDPVELARDIAALANSGGQRRYAELWIGITDKGAPCGINIHTRQDWRDEQQKIRTAVALIHPRPAVKVHPRRIGEVWVVRLQIATMEAFHAVDNEYYVRDHTARYPPNDKEIEHIRTWRYSRRRPLARRIGSWLCIIMTLIAVGVVFLLGAARLNSTLVWTLPGGNTAPDGSNQFLSSVVQGQGDDVVVYRGYASGSDLLVIDRATGAITRQVPVSNGTGLLDYDVHPQGTALIFTDKDGLQHTSLIEGLPETTHTLLSQADARLPRYSPDGSGIFVVLQGERDSIGWLPTNTHIVLPLRGYNPNDIRDMQVAPDGHTLVVKVYDDVSQHITIDLVMFDKEQACLCVRRQLWQTALDVWGLTFDATGRWVFAGVERYHIWGIDAINTTTLEHVPISAWRERAPSLAADGQSLLTVVQWSLTDYQIMQVPVPVQPTHWSLVALARYLEYAISAELVRLLRRLPYVVFALGFILLLCLGYALFIHERSRG